MSEQVVIDPLRFAFAAENLDGALDVARMRRLRDVLRRNEGAVSFSLHGALNPEGKPVLRLDVAGLLILECQRCLKDLPFAVRMHEELIIAGDEAELISISQANDERECVLADEKLSVPEMVEDEILLGLPISPRHRDCGLPA